MRPEDTEKEITDLNKFLESRHPSSVLQFITSTMVGWSHFDKSKPPSKSDMDIVWDKYLNLLRYRLDTKLSLVSSLQHSNAKQHRKTLPIPPHVFEKEKLNEIVTLLGNMPSDEALGFMVEVTTNWCFSIPINFLPLVPVTFLDQSDEAIADAIYAWLVRYCDLWH